MVSEQSSIAAVARPSRRKRLLAGIGHVIPGALALALVIALVGLGQRTGWRLSKFSSLYSQDQTKEAAWCEAHSVSDAICVECREEAMPREKDYGWCKLHGVHECPQCHPDVAQLLELPIVSSDDLQHTAAALEFAARSENNSRCKLHARRIQLASVQSLKDIGIDVAPAQQTTVSETISSSGEIGFDPTQVARISPRVSGVTWRINKRVGDTVRAGEIVALIDSAEVGKAKAEFQQALAQLELKTQSLARRKPLAGQTIAGNIVQTAEAEAAEAQVRMLASRQSLINLGLPVKSIAIGNAEPAEIARQLRFLGVPAEDQEAIAAQTPSNNLLPVRAPFDGVVIESEGVPGEAVDSNTVLCVIANTRVMWLTLHVALENADRIHTGQRVRFQHESHGEWDEGVVSFVGLAVDESTRTVPVKVELPNDDGRHVARTFGKANVLLREEQNAVVVPSSAIHWEGDCHVVFVRDKHFEHEGAPKVFHVRKVRPGVQDLALGTQVTEVIAGLLPGETVATTNSGIFRSELLKNNLGAG